jgi:hypothetical protein
MYFLRQSTIFPSSLNVYLKSSLPHVISHSSVPSCHKLITVVKFEVPTAVRSSQTFRSIVHFPSSGDISASLLALLFDPDGGGWTFFENADKSLLDYTAPCPFEIKICSYFLHFSERSPHMSTPLVC